MIRTNPIAFSVVALCLSTAGCSAATDRNATNEPEATPPTNEGTASSPSVSATPQSSATARYVSTQKSAVPSLQIIVADQPIDCDSPPPAGATYLTVAIPGVDVPAGTYPASSGARAKSAGAGAVSELDIAARGTLTLTQSFSSADPLSAMSAVAGHLDLVFPAETSSRDFHAKGCPATYAVVP